MKSIVLYILLLVSVDALGQCEYAIDDSIMELIGVPEVMPEPVGGWIYPDKLDGELSY